MVYGVVSSLVRFRYEFYGGLFEHCREVSCNVAGTVYAVEIIEAFVS